MSDTRSELKKLVPLYCDELNSLDLSLYENYVLLATQNPKNAKMRNNSELA